MENFGWLGIVGQGEIIDQRCVAQDKLQIELYAGLPRWIERQAKSLCIGDD